MLLKKVFNALNSLFMCISGSYSSNPRLTSLETLIPNNHFVWMRKGSCGWAFTLLVLDLILSIFVGLFMHWMSYLHAFCASCNSLYALFSFWSIFTCFMSKIQKHIKSRKSKKFDRHYYVLSHACLALYLRTNGYVHLRA